MMPKSSSAVLMLHPPPLSILRSSRDRNLGPEALYEYDLFAVVCHEGQIDNGHYTCFARSHDEVRPLSPFVLSGTPFRRFSLSSALAASHLARRLRSNRCTASPPSRWPVPCVPSRAFAHRRARSGTGTMTTSTCFLASTWRSRHAHIQCAHRSRPRPRARTLLVSHRVTHSTLGACLNSQAYMCFYVKRHLDYKPYVTPSYVVTREQEAVKEKEREREKEAARNKEFDDALAALI